MAAQYPYLIWEDVAEGQTLPGFAHELSLLRLLAFVRATGLYDPVHSDPEFARTVGAKDAFISTAHLAGLFSRLVTDWSGPASQLRRLTFSMASQMLRGDVLRFSGRVACKYRGPDGAYLVDLEDLAVTTDGAGRAAQATATLEMPSREGAMPAVGRTREDQAAAVPADDIPDFARAMMTASKAGKGQPGRPLTADEVHLWCEALEDWNPLYWDDAHARATPFGGIIAPHASTFYGAGSSTDIGIGYAKPGAKVPDAITQGLAGQALTTALRRNVAAEGVPFVPPGFPDVVVAQAEFAFYAPHRIGDALNSTLRLTACSPLRKTRLGEGHFLTVENALSNRQGQLVKTLTTTLLFYRT